MQEESTAVQTITDKIWEELKPKVDALVTQRVNALQDALLERGQISPMSASQDPKEEIFVRQPLHVGL